VAGVLADPVHADEVYRSAVRNSHPDHPGGSPEAFHLVTAARAAIDRGA